jgi:hypothetical protein
MVDSMFQGVPLPHRGTVHPLGFTLNVASNSPAAVRAANESWGQFPRAFQEPPVEIRVMVAGHTKNHRDREPVYRMNDHLFAIVADAENFATNDLERSFGFCWVTEDVIEDTAYFRHFFLESLAYGTLTHRYLTPVHGACVALDGSGVLLCGPSGAGKSCLAFACAQRGWSFLTDDFTSLVRKRSDRLVVGKPFVARFRPDAATLFPELRDLEPFVAANGKPSVELKTAQVPGIQTILNCRVDHVVFLERQDCTEPRIAEIPAENALSRLDEEMFLYPEKVAQEHQRSLRNLLPASFYILRYNHLDSAVTALENIVRKVALV